MLFYPFDLRWDPVSCSLMLRRKPANELSPSDKALVQLFGGKLIHDTLEVIVDETPKGVEQTQR